MSLSNPFSSWLTSSVTVSTDRHYWHHYLVEQPEKQADILEELQLYVHKAHADARLHFQELAGYSLDPLNFGSSKDPVRGYPETLPMDTLQGCFGEILAGLIAEYFSPFGIDEWKVPAFLFRFHNAAFHRLEQLSQTGGEAKSVPGRFGDDCLAFQLASSGDIVRSLYCEAKCTAGHDSHLIADAHEKVSEAEIVDLLQLIEVLKDSRDRDARKWIRALRRLNESSTRCERLDLVNYVCGRTPTRKGSWLPTDKPHSKYIPSERRKLAAVEIHLSDVKELIREVYGKQEEARVVASRVTTMKDEMDTQLDSQTLAFAQGVREQLVGTHFPVALAKLYSQHKLLSAHQSGLNSWTVTDAKEWLRNAVHLIDAGFTDKEAGNEQWSDSLRRAGEILEWLSHPNLNPDVLPLHLFSAAAYQLAGYPARARGVLYDGPENDESAIIHALLKAEFPVLFKQLLQYWSSYNSITPSNTATSEGDKDIFSEELERTIITKTMSALGIICAEMRWGEEPRMKVALEQLITIGKLFMYTKVPYSWLLAKLCTEVSSVYAASSIRRALPELAKGLNPSGKNMIERYLRDCYRNNKSLAWPSQIRGIEQLTQGTSFALCTPTGSGKTTVAEIAMIQSLFLESLEREGEETSAPLALYLVPSRALAAEVESELSRVFRHQKEPPIVVTGLYGGADWGPSDTWFASKQPTILICTCEKAEALIRFLGPLFLKRVSLIIIDEAHLIQFDGDRAKLQKAESRSLHLEAVSARLLTYLEHYQRRGKVIALSAVASNMQDALACWISGQGDASPVEISYRSTRQLVGRLECLPNREFMIYCDLLDGAKLQLKGESESHVPFIPRPFPFCPPLPEWEQKSTNQGPEKHLRSRLLWAAMQLAALEEKERQGAVLVSVTQYINSYAKDFLELLTIIEKRVGNPVLFEHPSFEPPINLPLFFRPPTEPKKKELWEKCLRSCEDYFGKESAEYRLLQKGIVVHHGKMPGLLARSLIELIDKGVVNLVLATSTLSEGVNLPFDTILIPSLMRNGKQISSREFINLIGRAGRPGFGTEGRSLVLLESGVGGNAHKSYQKLIDEFKSDIGNSGIRSPLAELLSHLQKEWSRISGAQDHQAFLNWLDQTAPVSLGEDSGESKDAIQALDTLDSILLSIIVEVEQLAHAEVSDDELEKQLIQVWQRSYTHYAIQQEKQLGEIFVRRGRALKRNIYPQSSQCRRLYRTGMPPISGNQLLSLHLQLKEYLKSGEKFAKWPPENRFEYIRALVDRLRLVPSLKIDEEIGNEKNKVTWDIVLRWWLRPTLKEKKPSTSSDWYEYVNDNFIYRFNWGLGSVISLAIDDANNGKTIEPSLENWPQTGLPWVVLWLKELITWGTLEPVAASLLARGLAVTRAEAEKKAEDYYAEQSPDLPLDELLNAITIREWVGKLSLSKLGKHSPSRLLPIKVHVERDFSMVSHQRWRVLPVENGDTLSWFDPAGYPLATGTRPENWRTSYVDTYDFILDPLKKVVLSELYI